MGNTTLIFLVALLTITTACFAGSGRRAQPDQEPDSPRTIRLIDEDGSEKEVDKKDHTDATAPAGWTCRSSLYDAGDGCDCGCGVLDADCESEASECDYQWCPEGTPLPDRNWECTAPRPETSPSTDPAGPADTAPRAWTCDAEYFGTGDGCDCGCGILDPDCTDAASSSCEYRYCPEGQSVRADANFECVAAGTPSDPPPAGVPSGWTCRDGYYGTDDGCDCGCGVVDADCESPTSAACDYEYCPTGTEPAGSDHSRCVPSSTSEPEPTEPEPTDPEDRVEGCGLPVNAVCSYRFDPACSTGTRCEDRGEGFRCHDYCEGRYSDGLCNTGCFDTDPDCLSQGALIGRACTSMRDCVTPESDPGSRGLTCTGGRCADACEILGHYDDGFCASRCPTRDPECGMAHVRSTCE